MAPELSDQNETKETNIFTLGAIIEEFIKNNNFASRILKSLVIRCKSTNRLVRPKAAEIRQTIDDLFDNIDDEYQLRNLDGYDRIDLNNKFGKATQKDTRIKYLYRIYDVAQMMDIENNLKKLMIVQCKNVLQIKYFYLFRNENGMKCLLLIEDRNMFTLKEYLATNSITGQNLVKYINDIIAAFESFHKYNFLFGAFTLERFFIDENSMIIIDIFRIPNLKYDIEIDPDFKTPESVLTIQSDIYQFGILVLKIYNEFGKFNGCYTIKNFKKTMIPLNYQINVKKCLDENPTKRISFAQLYKNLNKGIYKGVSSFLSLSTSRYSGFSINKIRDEDINFISLIGSGQFGEVSKVILKSTNEELAMKEYFQKNDCQDFYIEYAALKSLNHPHIVKVVGAMQGGIANHPRIFMEYASGGIFNNKMKESFEDFCAHLLQIASAMSYLHDRDIIHHDLKPENILIRSDNTAVITDFNIAIHLTNFESKLCISRGSVNYMSPEIYNSEPYSFSTDVFSFGLIIADYFTMDNHKKIFDDILNFREPDFSFIANEDMRRLVEFCLKRNPTERPPFRAITQFIVKKFLNNDNKYENLIKQKRMDDSKLKQIKTLSKNGDLTAINEYGKYLILEGEFEKADQIFKLGVDLNCPRAQNTCGALRLVGMFDYYVAKMRHINKNRERGYDITKDNYEKALKLFERSAAQNDKYGLVNYGYYKYEKQENNPRMAAKYYRRAIKQEDGSSFAKYLLGRLYLRYRIGHRCYSKALNKAIKLFEEGAQEGDCCCQYRYAMLIKEGVVPEDQSFLPWRELVRLSAYQRNEFAMFEYSRILKGTEFVKDDEYRSSDLICGFNPDWEYFQYFSDKTWELENYFLLFKCKGEKVINNKEFDDEIVKQYYRIFNGGLGKRKM